MNRNRLKITIDVVIALALVLLYNVHAQLGLAFHEWAGIIILVGFVLHVAVSWDWVVGVTRKFLTTTGRSRFQYVLDVLVLVTMVWAIISGVLISRVATPMLATHGAFWRITHVPVSYLTLVLIGVHLGMHWEWVLRVVRRLFRLPSASGVGRWGLRLVAVAVFAAGVYATFATDAVGRIARLSGATSASAETGGRGEGRPGTGMGRGRGTHGPGSEHARASGRRPGTPDRGGRSSGSDLTSLLLHSGIIAAFAVPVYYLDLATTRVRRARRPRAAARP